MKKSKNSVYIRYEFSNKAGTPEGGDIFEFTTLSEVQEMVSEVLKVAQIDDVAVNLTIGGKKPFYGFLKKSGMGREQIDSEIVEVDMAPIAKASPAPKKAKKAKKAAKKSKAKKK
jgi:hypothetical protein